MINKLFNSLKGKVLLVLVGALVPLLALIIVFNMYTLSEYNGKLIETNANVLAFKVKDIEYSMSKMEGAMLNIVVNKPDFRMFAFGEEDEYKDYMELYEVMSELDSEMYINKDWWASAIVSVDKDVYRIAANKTNTRDINGTVILDYLREKSEKEELAQHRKWDIHTIDDEYFMWRTLKQRNAYLIGMIDLSELLMDLNKNLGDGSCFVFLNGDEIYQTEDFIPENVLISNEKNTLDIGGRSYLYVTQKIENTDLTLAYFSPRIRIFNDVHNTQFLLVLISMLIIIVVPVSFYILNRIFLRPLNKLEKNMESLGATQMTVVVPPNESAEFSKVYNTLNDMIGKISDLQKELYVRQLEMNQVQLQYYQLQIRPHFYLNCLKSIYGMVQMGNMTDAEKTIVLLSKHLRYILSENGESIPVSKELEFIDNYIELQQVGQEKKIHYECSCDEALKDFAVPPVSLLSVVENSIKYSYLADRVLNIRVMIENLDSDDGRIAHFIIADNGKGYDSDVLDSLNMNEGKAYDDDSGQWHIGLNNMMQRFKLLYGDNAYFAFGNYDGAETEIFISNEVSTDENPTTR